MVIAPYRRILGLILILGAVGCCLIWFGSLAPAPGLGVPADNEDVVPNPATFVGAPIAVDGPVIETTPLTIRLQSESGATLDLRVTGVNRPLSEGDVLSVYGTLESENQVSAINTVRKPAGNYWRTRVLSLLAGLWVLWRGLRYWRPNVQAVLIERRQPPLSSLLTRFDPRETEDEDA
ncbi:hypothetical protein [Haloarcula amylovorans]|uniref:hypothetical protein n=1 Tax=Haloarcula amylovorans TaxID=2562280 RepID=UPI0010763896|nr:hypothetical protein [Halomicroarcula amylolytica]